MKTITLSAFMLAVSLAGFAQSKSLDDMFSKFENKNGVTSVNISKDMMEFVAQMDSMDSKSRNFLSKISQVKILVLNQASMDDKSSFNLMAKSLPLSDYKELMVVKENNQNIKMMLRENQGKVSEFLLLVTGDKEQVILSIRGNIDPKDLKKLSSRMHMKGFEYLAHLNKGKKTN